MGVLTECATALPHLLEPEYLIGRAHNCTLRIAQRYISAQHALLRWTGQRWEVKDLGSRNGTYVDGTRLRAGEGHALRRGAKVAFGKGDHEWELVEDAAPSVMAVPIKGGDAVVIDGDLLALPSADDPQVTIYRTSEGTWVLEQLDELITPITNLQIFVAGERSWRFSCPEGFNTTSLAVAATDLEVRHLQLAFSVSRDEEHVHLQMTCGGNAVDMGTRTHNYLLLTLARRRLADVAEGLPDTTCGWVYQEDLSRDPSMAPPQLNIDVFRIRKQFAAAGVIDAAGIVERRPRTRQLRIGTGRLSVVTL
ncbi:MAG TPA: FHA domain-containing protein [Polyangiaceae bacterium]|jgi:hypothetical protein|nr:FHA domain-containing protein [Polyangiaceae bacterium]